MLEKNSVKFQLKDFSAIFLVFICAFFLRIVYLSQYQGSPFFDSPVIDALSHYIYAVRISAGDWLLKGTVIGRSPLYIYALAVIFKIFGPGYLIPRVLQLMLGAINCCLVYILGKKIFSRGVGFIAALMCSMYGVLIYFDAEFLNVGMTIFLNILTLLWLINTMEKPKVSKWILSGVFLGVCLQTSANIIMFIPLIFIWLKNQTPKPDPENPSPKIKIFQSKPFKQFIFILLGLMMVMMPFALRNYIQGGDFVLISSSGGINFYIGNNPLADGKTAFAVNRDFSYDAGWEDNILTSSIAGAEQAIGRALSPSEVSRFWFQKALGFIIHNPLDWMFLTSKKFYYFFNAYEIPENQSIYFYRMWSSLLKMSVFTNNVVVFPFGIICPLAVLGIIVSFKKDRKVRLLVLFVFSHLILMVIFFVCSRYRAPIIPCFLIFAAYAIIWILKKLKEMKFGKVGLALLILIGMYVFSNATIFEVRNDDDSRWFLNLGTAFRYKNQNAKALKAFKSAKNINPKNIDAVYNLGVLSLDMGDYAQAEQEFKAVLDLDPEDSAAFSNLGLVSFKQDDYAQAVEYFNRALELDPKDPSSGVNLGATYLKLIQLDKAKYILTQTQKNNPDFAPVYLHLGILHEAKVELAMAEKAYIKAISLNPDYFQAYYNLAAVYARMGKSKQAQEFRLRALEIFPDKLNLK